MERKIILSHGIIFPKVLIDTTPLQVTVRSVLIDSSLSEVSFCQIHLHVI